MIRQSATYRIPRPSPLQEGRQVALDPARGLCTRCGGIGTHYLTCPSLRLPHGYRLSGDSKPG